MKTKIIYRKTIGYTTYGVLDTPMWPCRYYVGQIRQDRDEAWCTTDNSTHLFHRTLHEATEAFKNIK